jgi:CheY-like chemotaxis protein
MGDSDATLAPTIRMPAMDGHEVTSRIVEQADWTVLANDLDI